LNPLPGLLFGTQAPNATTVLFALIVLVTMIFARTLPSHYRHRGVALALASGAIVAVKNYVQEAVVSPGPGTAPGDLRLNGEMLEWVAVAQVAMVVLYLLLSSSILRYHADQWMAVSTLLLAAAVASMWAAVGSAEWAHTFYERAQQGGIGDYEPLSQLLHIALVAAIGIFTLKALVHWRQYYRVPRPRRRVASA
jgi:hypothetical protein